MAVSRRLTVAFLVGLLSLAAAIRVYDAYWPLFHKVTLPVQTDSGRSILAIFTPDDCSTYGALIGFLNSAADRGTNVVGVMVDDWGNATKSENPSTVNSIKFPIRPQYAPRAARMMTQMGYRTTPIIALLDERGRVRAVVPPMPDIVLHARLVRWLLELDAVAAGGNGEALN